MDMSHTDDSRPAEALGAKGGEPAASKSSGRFRYFFLRGLAILLPSVLTIWILMAGYRFVQSNFAEPINIGVRELLVLTAPWPNPQPRDFDLADQEMTAERKSEWNTRLKELVKHHGSAWSQALEQEARLDFLRRDAKRAAVLRWWQSARVGTWTVLDLVGLIIAVVLIYFAGAILSSFIGHRLFRRGEQLLNRVPLIRNVYPAVKQVTDFLVGDQQKVSFSQVVAVQYPRMGIWSLGLVTGDTLRRIQDTAGQNCVTVFVPSSPTPFTGYVITVPRVDVIDLPMTIEEALKFVVSGGVLVPPGEKIAVEAPDRPGRILAADERG
jgi:uncharacterized membrane protein